VIVVDTSALAAIFQNEPAGLEIERVLSSTRRAFVPVSCIAEIAVLNRMGPKRFHWLDRMLAGINVETVSIDAEAAPYAVQAARRYGKGTGHPAQLNFGDCLSYAVARSRDLPLLYVGKDFRHTDVRSVF
jgi:ribonuclease VapC